MTSWDLMMIVKAKGALPLSNEQPCTEPSNSELRRWFKTQSIVINEVRAGKDDAISFPVWELIFFPKGKRRTSIASPNFPFERN